MKHEWEATDTEGHAMQCVKCGLEIFFHDGEDWDNNVDGECEGKTDAEI